MLYGNLYICANTFLTNGHKFSYRNMNFSDGLWSAWSAWGSCSATCLGGLQKRNRTCDSPAPSSFGHMCVGTDEEYQTCNNKNCAEGNNIYV